MPHSDELITVDTIRDEDINIAFGRVSGMLSIHKFGANVAVGTTTEDLWSVGGVYPWPIAPETIRVQAGGNIADTAAGLGARTIVIEGLNENWEVSSDILTLAGASASAATATTYIRVYRAYVATTGAYTAANTGIITIENTATNDTLAEIQAGYGQSQMTHFTVPADKFALIFPPSVTVDANQVGNVRFCQRQNADVISAPFSSPRVLFEVDAFVGSKEFRVKYPIKVPEKTDIWADGTAAASTASINAEYDLVLIDA